MATIKTFAEIVGKMKTPAKVITLAALAISISGVSAPTQAVAATAKPEITKCARDGNPYNNPFVNGADGYEVFRGPVITAFGASGTVLATATAQKDEGDWGWNDIVAKTSFDGGCTWEKLQKIFVSKRGEAHGTQVPFWVPNKPGSAAGKLVLISTSDTEGFTAGDVFKGKAPHRKAWVQEARYGGDKKVPVFGEPREITDQVTNRGPDFRYEERFIASGPVHGVRIKNGPHKGRLVVPINSVVHDKKSNNPESWVFAGGSWYSDDAGVTWKPGAFEYHPTANLNENSVTEIGDQGWLQFNMRNQGGKKPSSVRIQTISKDGGQSFSAPWAKTDTSGPWVQGAQLTVKYKGKERVLLSFPAKKPGGALGTFQERGNMWIHASEANPVKTWQSGNAGPKWEPKIKVSDLNGYGYSDMAIIGDNMIGILFEGQVRLGDKILPVLQWHRYTLDEIFASEAPKPEPTATPKPAPTVAPSAQPGAAIGVEQEKDKVTAEVASLDAPELKSAKLAATGADSYLIWGAVVLMLLGVGIVGFLRRKHVN